MKNQLTVQGGRKGKDFTPVTQILQNPSQFNKLQTFIDECVQIKHAILTKNEDLKELRKSAVEELNIEPKMFSKLVSLYYNNNFDQQRDEAENWEHVLDVLMNQRLS